MVNTFSPASISPFDLFGWHELAVLVCCQINGSHLFYLECRAKSKDLAGMLRLKIAPFDMFSKGLFGFLGQEKLLGSGPSF